MESKFGMTVEEASRYTSIGRNTLRALVDAGKLPVLRIGRKNIIRTRDPYQILGSERRCRPSQYG